MVRRTAHQIHPVIPESQHQIEIQRNLEAWKRKPLLQEIYSGFYERIGGLIDPSIPGKTVELGSGIGNLKGQFPHAIATDLFPNPWIDQVCDAYDLPFADASLSHLVLFDVWHHLRQPNAFLREAHRTLAPRGRVILFEPFISWASFPVYGWLHHEPVGWRQAIDAADVLAAPRDYYAAQGNATRLFFRNEWPAWPVGWIRFHASAFSSFSYLLSGGYSKPAVYPASWLWLLQRADAKLSRWPKLFGARCLVGLERLALGEQAGDN